MEVLPIRGLPEILPGCDLARLLWEGAKSAGTPLRPGDVLVVASKAVSKWQGCLRRLEEIVPGPEALRVAEITGRVPEYCQVVLDESVELVRLAPGVVITRTKQGFVLANSGVDGSNTTHPGEYLVLPEDPDALAEQLRRELAALCGGDLAVIISDTFGRPWRTGQTDLAVGCAGLAPLLDMAGKQDDIGQTLRYTAAAVADELAGAADLVAGKTGRVPAVLIRGYDYAPGEGGIQSMLMPRERDLFGSDC